MNGRKGQLRNVLLGGLGGFGAGSILCRLLKLPGTSAGWFVLTALLGGFLAAAAYGRSPWKGGILLAAGAVFAVAAGVVGFGQVLWCLLLLMTVFVCFGAVTAGGFGFYGPLGVFGVLLTAAALLLSGKLNPFWRWISLLAAGSALLLTVDGFRESSLQKAHHLRKQEGCSVKQEGRRHSLLLCGIFLLLCGGGLAAAWGIWRLGILQIFRWLLYGTGAFGYWLAKWLQRFMLWLKSLLDLIPEPRGGHPDGGGGSWIELKPYTGGSELATLILVILTLVGAMAVMTSVGVLLLRRKKQPQRTAAEVEDYVDEVESLRRKKRRPLSGLFEKRREYQGKMKIRYAFQLLLKRRERAGEQVFAKTPNELRDKATAENALIDAYNRVRYGEAQPAAEELAAADRYIKGRK